MRLWSSFSSLIALWLFGLLAAAILAARGVSGAFLSCSRVGAQGLDNRSFSRISASSPRINVLEVDVWRHSLVDGSLRPVARIPMTPPDLISPDDFSPERYLASTQALDDSYTRQRDVLMYYGGLPAAAKRHGLNFNAWSLEDLRRLRARNLRPFVGLETMDPRAVEWMARHLHEAGYGPLQRIYVRIGAEPSGMPYGTEDGSSKGKRHTPAAYASYRRLFARTSGHLDELNRRYSLNMHRVFAGTNAEDFNFYLPPPARYDAVGYDLYVTPENKEKTLRQIRRLRDQLPGKPLVIPELGMATAGPGASPRWAQETLGEILMALGRHPGGIAEVTVFSVNAAGRLPARRWNWAWTPAMFDMLKEWELSTRRWRKDGVHRYDPSSYPPGRDVLYLNRSDLRIVYRKLAEGRMAGASRFHEVRSVLVNGRWNHRARLVTLEPFAPSDGPAS